MAPVAAPKTGQARSSVTAWVHPTWLHPNFPSPLPPAAALASLHLPHVLLSLEGWHGSPSTSLDCRYLPWHLPGSAPLQPTCFVLVNVFTDCIRGVDQILFLRCCVRPADPALCSAWLKQFQHTTEPSRTLSRIVHSLLNEPGLYLHPVRPGRLITEPATSSL